MFRGRKAETAETAFSWEIGGWECCFNPKNRKIFQDPRHTVWGAGPFFQASAGGPESTLPVRGPATTLPSSLSARPPPPIHIRTVPGWVPSGCWEATRPHKLSLRLEAGTSEAFVAPGPHPSAPGCSGRGTRPAEWRLGGPGGRHEDLTELPATQMVRPQLTLKSPLLPEVSSL